MPREGPSAALRRVRWYDCAFLRLFTQGRQPPRVTRGELAEFILLTAPDARCDIALTYASGPPDLDAPAPQTADRDGNLRFAWNVNKSAPVGQATAAVHCNNDTARATFIVI